MAREKIQKRIGSLIRLRPEFEERYIILHKHVLPGVLARIRKSNIRNYSIFLRDGILFSHYEYVGRNYSADMKAIAADSTTREWWKLTDPMQQQLPSCKRGEWWSTLDLVLHIDKRTLARSAVQRYGYFAAIKHGAEKFLSAIAAALPSSIPLFEESHVQNLRVYFQGGKLYIYFEYTGNNLKKDTAKLLNNPALHQWKRKAGKFLLTSFCEMKEVFYMP